MNYITDYRGRRTYLPFHIEDPQVIEATVHVISGDENLTVLLKAEDGSVHTEEFTSTHGPLYVCYDDGEWVLKKDGKLTRDFYYTYGNDTINEEEL